MTNKRSFALAVLLSFALGTYQLAVAQDERASERFLDPAAQAEQGTATNQAGQSAIFTPRGNVITLLAETQRGSQAAVYGVGPGNSPLQGQSSAPAGTMVWVDTHSKTLIEGWTEYNPFNCTDTSPGSYTIVGPPPAHGHLYFDIEDFTLTSGPCSGYTFPFAVARYKWTDPNQLITQDPFTLVWSTPDGKFMYTNAFIAELAVISQGMPPTSVWWVCGATQTLLPGSALLILYNPPSGASSYVWTITAGSDKLVFSNGTSTITTASGMATVMALQASTAMNDVTIQVAVQGLLYSFYTDVRAPWQLRRRPSLDLDRGRGANCNVPGTQGWESLVGYEVDDQFGVNTATPDYPGAPAGGDAGVNEKIRTKTDFQPNDWVPGTEGGDTTVGGVFQDYLCRTETGRWHPNPEKPQNPLTNDKVVQFHQTWHAGDSMEEGYQGCEVQTDNIVEYIDHGRHMDIVSPPAGPPEPDGQATAAGSATSHPMPVQNVRYLEGQSTLIVKGRVLTVNQLGTIKKPTGDGALTFQQMTASVQVDEVLKGTLGSGVVTVEFLRNSGGLTTTLDQDEYALLFLTAAPDGGYTFADPQIGKMPITSRNVPAAGASQTTAGKIEAELFASLCDPNREVSRTALVQVANLGSVQSTQAIRNIATAGDPEFQGLAYAALLRLGDYSLLNQAIRFAEQPGQDLEVTRQQFGVAEAIGDIQNRSVLPALNSLLSSPSVSLRRAAAKAMRGMSDPSSAPFLVRALQDSDADVQYNAVMALAAMAGASAENAPARDSFNQDPAKYLGYWTNWWQASGKGKN